jgi:hypothetical protein
MAIKELAQAVKRRGQVLEECAMAAIPPFVKHPLVFAPEVTRSMSIAFDEVCRALDVPDTANETREVIATRIIELAGRGERDTDRLRAQMITEAGAANVDGSGRLK